MRGIPSLDVAADHPDHERPVELWVPEVGGAVDPGSDAHDLVMSLYGGMSKGERNRIKTRVRSAMAAQAAVEGRFLGGRPPYGYTLADAGPHPNPSKAAIGQRLHRLERDPSAAPVVHRIFSDFLAGKGAYAIAEVERERRSIERDLGRKPTPRKHTKNEIKGLVRQLKDIVGTLANADPEDKRAVYDELGVNLTYHQDGRVHVAAGARVLRDRVGGPSSTRRPPSRSALCSI
jgi:hypothetical protein